MGLSQHAIELKFHLVHVDERTNPQDSSYDMILGMDILTKLGIVMDLKQKIIHWKEDKVELKPRGMLKESHVIEEI